MLYAIGDLHLSNSVDKPMNIFGDNWDNHQMKIEENWKNKVKDEDVVLILGDTSWGINLEQAMPDLEFVSNLPGKKIVIKGNHDYWWNSLNKINNLFDNIKFLQNNFYQYEDYAICGARGWLCPNDVKFDENDNKIYERETHRLKLSLDSAKKNGFENIIVITHYPPTNDKFEDSNFTKLYEEYKVKKVMYGHIHGNDSFKYALEGMRNGIEYTLASCDYINFDLIKVLDI